MESSLVAPGFGEVEQHRGELTGYCYRMLGSPFDAEDAVQETLVRAWSGLDRFQGRAAVRSWLYRIATNVCLDMLEAGGRRARPIDLGPARAPLVEHLQVRADATWIEPIPDPVEVTVRRASIRLAFVAALQHLPPRQRVVLLLRDVFRFRAAEVAELLETTVASANSLLQRARETIAGADMGAIDEGGVDRRLLDRYVAAFEAYDMDALTALIREDARQSMPPYDLWLAGRDDILAWWVGPGAGCRGSRVVAAGTANGSPAFGQYKPSPAGDHVPWALQVVEWSGGRIGEFTFFLAAERLFPRFGLPARLAG